MLGILNDRQCVLQKKLIVCHKKRAFYNSPIDICGMVVFLVYKYFFIVANKDQRNYCGDVGCKYLAEQIQIYNIHWICVSEHYVNYNAT